MLKKWWLLLGFPGGPTTEIQVWSILNLKFQKSCRKKLARVPPSLVIFRFRQITIDFAFLWFHKMALCHFVKSQKSILKTCEITKMQNCQFWKLVKSQKCKMLGFPKLWKELLRLDINYIYFEDCNDQVKGRGSQMDGKKNQSNHHFEGCSSMNLDGQV